MKGGEAAARWRTGEGEEARLTPGAAAAAEVWSRGFLPLRVRSEGSFRLRPAFPGTAVVLGDSTYEVLSETELPEDGLVVYRMRLWPEGEVVRDRVVYGPTFVRAAETERERARLRERARPWRLLLYPLVGLLPEEEQERLCDRLGLYAVTATLVSGLVESLGVLLLLLTLARASEGGRAIMLVASLPGLVLLVLPGLGRAFGALFLRETGGSAPVVLALDALRALGALEARRDRSFVPLTRSAFWERLLLADNVETAPDDTLVVRGLLPHLTWGSGRRLSVGRDYWSVVPEPPAFERGRLVYSYRLEPLGDPPAPGEPPPSPPPADAYAEEVLAQVRREWDSLDLGFAWLTSMLGAELQARAFDHRGGPAAARRPTMATALAAGLLGAYVLSWLPGGPAADPLAPVIGATAVLLLADAVRRIRTIRRGRYAPSLFRWLLPSDSLPPERLAWHAHRDAEREALEELVRPVAPGF
jgi:hypothetical protein